jgi:uncharacterized membrane protein
LIEASSGLILFASFLAGIINDIFFVGNEVDCLMGGTRHNKKKPTKVNVNAIKEMIQCICLF